MTIRRQKNIADTARELDVALDARDVLLAKLVRLELKIRKLKQRSARAQKAYVAKGDPSSVSLAMGIIAETIPYPFRHPGMVAGDDELDDAIPL